MVPTPTPAKNLSSISWLPETRFAWAGPQSPANRNIPSGHEHRYSLGADLEYDAEVESSDSADQRLASTPKVAYGSGNECTDDGARAQDGDNDGCLGRGDGGVSVAGIAGRELFLESAHGEDAVDGARHEPCQ